ncbi:glycosyltransferase family 1 protein [Leptospira gomenensis]|uniref:Glycosyltransferase family 1 protein n=1 Tax=Leptospira gomenensis TaxID=2484974 RepID=A0A5F1Y7Z1_9LEPT|nr:glycosyltransferase family 1 protein [Leptospira gomenensis]TGK30897.1 glycosyltransferase family 1 protein [Leptospira gomenensis]TGK32535.1 glycosyltransferase family 1 protein [Leptospira gomenensis]TGK45383.1 glycosyltransferase family 1 protein [Leptospira gomenensis]TGK60625.1 glycosyltransferase family 1 protein [Leptospira gomenensis]
MRVLYDHQTFSLQRFGGISRYFSELIEHFDICPDCDVEPALALWINRNEYIRSYRKNSFLDELYPHSFAFPGKNRITNLLNQPRSSNMIRKGSFDVFHPTYYFDYYSNILNKPYVITVYDMIHERFPDYLVRDPIRKTKRAVVENADAIIAISEHTKKDLVELFGIPEDLVRVIHLSASGGTSSPSQKIPLPDADFILFVGNRDGYKNFDFFVQAAAPFIHENNRIFLYCAGGGDFSEKELFLLEEYGLKERAIQKEVSDSELKFLYENARVFVFPSLYEGFGIPVLESMNHGCVPLLSNSSSLPEIGAEAAFYFDPRDKDSFVSTLESAWKEGKERDTILRAGKKRAADFSWKKTAEKTAEVYRSLL